MRAFVLARWPMLVAAAATLAYAGCVLGFGLVFRPLHNDEGVTLDVASAHSVRGVLDIAVNYRHGPPLHYLLVHFSLLWRDDVLGLRLPSAVLGIVSVALAYGFGRELLGRAGGAIVAVVIAVSPAVVNLGQFSRGYTAMLAASFGSLWLLLVLLRTRQARWVAPYAVAATLLAASHPFGLFALFSELILLALLGVVPLARKRDRRAVLVVAGAIALGVVALLALHHAYAPLQEKYGVGSGSSVVDPLSSAFWSDLGEAWTGHSSTALWVAVILVALAGIGSLAFRDRRAALICVVWLGQPLLTLTVLTAASSDFAPERHLSFLLPGYAVAVAAAALELARRAGGRGPWVAAGALALLLTPGAIAIVDDVGNFTPDLRDSSLMLADSFGPDDVLLTTTGGSEPGVASRLYGAYAVLEAPDSSPLSRWRHVGDATGCVLVRRLSQHPSPQGAWLLLRPPDPSAVAAQLTRVGADPVTVNGEFVLARMPLRTPTVAAALRSGGRAFRAAASVSQPVLDFATVATVYRVAAAFQRAGVCG
jgi:4-amino-4-deoxy-L-arabinose transferase-like glycosyltransferase